ncbi:hypothetical protein ACFQ61_02075 [Streptomyces sp. NPDC056500]|uniref:hypothetical protein n=1 Tax=Streptomyces sp. NPDC056500 TaxID=3345840 RepID=UPI0036BEFFD9
MAVPKTTRAPRRTVSVQPNAQFDADLALIMRTGMNRSEAIRVAVELLASAYDYAWESGLYPPGVAPRRMGVRLAPYDPPTAPDQQV